MKTTTMIVCSVATLGLAGCSLQTPLTKSEEVYKTPQHSLFSSEETAAQQTDLNTDREVSLRSAFVHHHGIGVPKNHMVAIKNYNFLVDQYDDVRAMNDLAMLYLDDGSPFTDYNKGILLLEKASAKNNASATYNLGAAKYLGSYNVQQDQRAGLDLIETAALQGNVPAQAFMSNWIQDNVSALSEGTADVSKIENQLIREKYFRWAEEGSVELWQIRALGSNYMRLWDDFFSRDLDTRSKNTIKSDLLALESNCNECSSGNVHVVSRKLANISIWRDQANNGDEVAQYNLGVSYLTGDGVPKFASKGVRYLMTSAQRGYVPAQYALAKAYLEGDGVNQSKSEAYSWFNIAASAPSGSYAEVAWAKSMRGWMEKHVSKKDVEMGHKLSTLWMHENGAE